MWILWYIVKINSPVTELCEWPSSYECVLNSWFKHIHICIFYHHPQGSHLLVCSDSNRNFLELIFPSFHWSSSFSPSLQRKYKTVLGINLSPFMWHDCPVPLQFTIFSIMKNKINWSLISWLWIQPHLCPTTDCRNPISVAAIHSCWFIVGPNIVNHKAMWIQPLLYNILM
jgi:hypothetical protein